MPMLRHDPDEPYGYTHDCEGCTDLPTGYWCAACESRILSQTDSCEGCGTETQYRHLLYVTDRGFLCQGCRI